VTPGPCMGRPFKGLYDIVYFRLLRSPVCQFSRANIATHGRTTEYSYIVISRFLPDFPCACAPLKPDALCSLFPVSRKPTHPILVGARDPSHLPLSNLSALTRLVLQRPLMGPFTRFELCKSTLNPFTPACSILAISTLLRLSTNSLSWGCTKSRPSIVFTEEVHSRESFDPLRNVCWSHPFLFRP
jgi:hypothetical protein